ncbi:MAG TPA: transcriptional regulator, partial [Anaerovoracaceae bacterium]|nr:transcriptional regulator [Anaerovoracaceae bacterium]
MMETAKIDFKKKDKNLYMPGTKPSLIEVPSMNFIMVDGKGDPNAEDGEYQQAVELLYALSYTIKMGYKKSDKPDGYSDYVVPPLEGLWWLDGGTTADSDFSQKGKYFWTSMIRQPEFVTHEVFEQALREVSKNKPTLDPSKARFEIFE